VQFLAGSATCAAEAVALGAALAFGVAAAGLAATGLPDPLNAK
jgi:hypothetical protein